MAGSAALELLKKSDPGSGMHSVYYDTMAHRKDALVSGEDIGFERILTEEKTLFFGSSLSATGRKEIAVLDLVDSIHGQIGWNFQKGSELTEFFNFHLAKMYETGIFDRIYLVHI